MSQQHSLKPSVASKFRLIDVQDISDWEDIFNIQHPNQHTLQWCVCVTRQAWPVLTAVHQRPPQTVPPLSADGHSEATGQQHLGGGARTVTVSAVHHLIRWGPPPPVALAGQGAGPGPRALTPAGEVRTHWHCIRYCVFSQPLILVCKTLTNNKNMLTTLSILIPLLAADCSTQQTPHLTPLVKHVFLKTNLFDNSFICLCSGTKGDAQSATHPMYPTSRQRQPPIFTLSWPRPCWSKPEETRPHPFSPSPQPAGATRGPTEICTCVPLRLAYMLLASTTLSHPTGCPGPTPPMCLGSLVRDTVFETETWRSRLCLPLSVSTHSPSCTHTVSSLRPGHGDRQCGPQHFGGVLGWSSYPTWGGIIGWPSITSQRPQHG